MIEVKNLGKTFIKYEKEAGLLGLLKAFFNAKKIEVHAVEDISFTIKTGEIVGYIGANGAGKSTTIKMLTGILTPSKGMVKVDGRIPYLDRTENAKNIGVVFGQRTQLWWDLPLVESFSVLKEIYDVSDEDYKQRLSALNEILDLDEFMSSPVRTLSLGQRMRADIAAALLHQPKVLYLDEPTIGLDVNAKKKMRLAIKEMNQRFNTTVILTTHDLDDIEELCSRVLIVDHGHLVYDGALSDIKKRFGSKVNLRFDLKQNIDIKALKLSNKVEVDLEDNILNLRFDKNEHSLAQLSSLVFSQAEVLDMSILETPIEEIVGMIYQAGKV